MTPLESEIWNKFLSIDDDDFLFDVIDKSIKDKTTGVVIVEMDSAPLNINELNRNVVLAYRKPNFIWPYFFQCVYSTRFSLSQKFSRIFKKHIFSSVYITIGCGKFQYSSRYGLSQLNGQKDRVAYPSLRMIEVKNIYYLFIPLNDIKVVKPINKIKKNRRRRV